MLLEKEVYRIQLPQFEGPFDLLLFFIERDELDIYDIPIARITRDFMDYMHQMQQLNIELASDFILVAGTLMRIKSRMLIPRPQLNADGTTEDPRQELVDRLLEYKRHKAVLADLERIEAESLARVRRGFTIQEEKLILAQGSDEEELVGVDVYTILHTFRRVWERHQDREARPRHVIKADPFTIDQLKNRIRHRLESEATIAFTEVVLEVPEKFYAVCGLLAILELAQAGLLTIVIGEGFNQFWLRKAA